MKSHIENDVQALSSWIMGAIGVGILLTPSHLSSIITGIPSWAVVSLGIFCYSLSLSIQAAIVLTVSRNMRALQRYATILTFLFFTALYIRAGYLVEAIILFLIGTLQFIQTTRLRIIGAKINALHLTFTLAGVSSGIFLAATHNPYPQIDLSPFKILLISGFWIASLCSAVEFIAPKFKFNAILRRLQAIPWLAWCFLFIPSVSMANMIAPGMFGLMILATGQTQWNRWKLPENDVLGRRVVMSAGTIMITLLIFLSALLIIIDSSLKTIPSALFTVRDASLLFFIIISVVVYYTVSTVVMTLNGLLVEFTISDDAELEQQHKWNNRLAKYIQPFVNTREGERFRVNAQLNQINLLSRQLSGEKKRNAQLTLLMELSQQLENQLDKPVAAQLTINTLERALNCSLVSLYTHEPDKKEFMLLAATGDQINIVPPGYRQDSSTGAIGRAVRQRKTQIINDIRLDAEYIKFENETSLSAVIVPMIFNGYVTGMIAINGNEINSFDNIDIALVEAIAAELLRAWERSGYHHRLMNLVQSGSHLSAMVEPETTAREVAASTREILEARFTFVHIQLGQERNFIQSASSGPAPRLLASLEKSSGPESFVQAAFHAAQPFRIRDVRKYSLAANLDIDHPSLRSALAIPIRWHGLNIGAILVFGKQNEVFFTENDEALAELLSIQAAGAFESAWLQQELRASLRTTSLLYRLSNQIIQTDNIQNAAVDIAQTAHKLAKSASTGIVLFNADQKIIADAQINGVEITIGVDHPMDIISEAMSSGQTIYLSQGQANMRACLPILTPIHKYGAVWMNIPEGPGHISAANPNDLQALVNQAAIALERSLLLTESRRQAAEIKDAYDMLEATYDQTLAALTSALDARDQETEGHSLRVSHLAAQLGEALNLSQHQLKILERGSLMHDIGKIGISDTILHKPGSLSEEEWKIMQLHPDIGAKIVDGIPFLQDTIPLIRCHQERWDGSGYPAGLRAEEIPLLARVFSIVDAYDALTSNRPYRVRISAHEAIAYLREQAGLLFDPGIVEVFEKLILQSEPRITP